MTNNNLHFTNYKDNANINAFITNLGKYNEGELIGQWASLPLNDEEVKELYNNIGINKEYEEIFITDYDFNIEGLEADMLGYSFGEYASIEELSKLAEAIEDLDEWDRDKLSSILELEGASSIEDIMFYINDLDSYELYYDLYNDYDIGYHYLEEMGIYDLDKLGQLADYIDYERFGRDCRLDSAGGFVSKGYLEVY